MGVEVCPVHRAEFKKSIYIPYIHVGAMSQNPQPGGLKRKRPDDEDEDEDPPSAAPSRRQQPPCATKNKQEILDLTYSKLERYKSTPNSGLSRYVLMINTARNLEQELMRDGIKLGPSNFVPGANQVPFDPTRPLRIDDAKCNLSTLEEVVTSVNYPSSSYAMDTDSKAGATSVISTSDAPSDIFGGLSNGTAYVSEYDRYLMDLDGPSSGRATPFVRSDVESCALWNDDSDRLTSLNWSSVLNLSSVDGGNAAIAASSYYSETTAAESSSSAANCHFDGSSNSSSSGCSSDCSVSDDAMSGSETSLHTLMPVTTTGMSTVVGGASSSGTSSSSSPRVTSSALGSSTTSSQSGSSPPNSEDEIFGDIDLALYDYDFTPLSPPNVRMAPVSAEELMQSLSSDHQRIDNLGEHLTPVRT